MSKPDSLTLSPFTQPALYFSGWRFFLTTFFTAFLLFIFLLVLTTTWEENLTSKSHRFNHMDKLRVAEGKKLEAIILIERALDQVDRAHKSEVTLLEVVESKSYLGDIYRNVKSCTRQKNFL